MAAAKIRIVCRKHSLDVGLWLAWIDDRPFDGEWVDDPAIALRRFLESTFPDEMEFDFSCDQAVAGVGTLKRDLIWRPPEILATCTECRGSGAYVGLLCRESCRICEGKGYLELRDSSNTDGRRKDAIGQRDVQNEISTHCRWNVLAANIPYALHAGVEPQLVGDPTTWSSTRKAQK